MKKIKDTLDYVKAQKINIIPIKYKDKKSVVEWTVYQKELFSEDNIKEYFKGDIEYNIGFICGEISDNLVGLDFDSNEAYKQFYPDYKQLELETTVVKSAKGVHVYFKTEYPTDYMQIVDKEGKEVMSLRGNGHYIVAPPSIHPDGTQYTFISNNEIKRLKDIDFKQELREKAERLGYKIKGHKEIIEIEKLLKGCSKGQRDNNLLRLITICRKIGKTEEDAKEICNEWNKRCSPPLNKRDIDYKVRYHYARSEPYNYRYDKNLLKIDITPQLKLIKSKLKQFSLKDVHSVCCKWFKIVDPERIDLMLAVALTMKVKSTPVWVFFIGASGDLKSELLRSIEGMENVIVIDQITKNTFASGMKDVDDLGSKLENRSVIILILDLACLTSMKTDDKRIIWAQFRNLFDGKITKDTGSGVNKKYNNCHITILAGSTSNIRSEILIHNALGTRELMYDTQAEMIDNIDKMKKALENENWEKEMRQEISSTIQGFLHHIEYKKIELDDELIEFLMGQANMLAIMRATCGMDWQRE